jgi:glycerol-3-phosphate dehydrogenase subunit B
LLDYAPDVTAAFDAFVTARPQHPYTLAGLDALQGGIAALRTVAGAAGINFLGDPDLSGLGGANFRLPTALGAAIQVALAPESFAAGDLRQPGAMLIAGPAGWRDFYPRLCAENLARQGVAAQAVTFDLPEMHTSKFDATPVGLARLFDRPEVRARVAAQLKPKLDGAARVGLPAILGLAHSAEAHRDLSDRLGAPVFEIPTLPPSVPGMRLFNAFKAALTAAGVPILLDMTATRGIVEGTQAAGMIIPNVVRDQTYRAGTFILATGGLYGGGITSDFRGELQEAVFGLPLRLPGAMDAWFGERLLPASAGAGAPAASTQHSHAVHLAGVRANRQMQPLDGSGCVVLANVRVAGRLLADYDPVAEGSTEGVWLATAYRAASL